MSTIRILFTRRNWNPISFLIRWALPRTRFALALSSHCLIVDGDHVIEATMLHGVRRGLWDEAMRSVKVVRVIDYQVPDAAAGIKWARQQVGTKYDWLGAFGLLLDPDRDWQADDRWFCFELAAATLIQAGRDVFADRGHMTEASLFAIKP